MSYFAQPVSPFSGMTLTSCMSKNPAACCLNQGELKCHIGVNEDYNVYKLSYETGAEVILGSDFQMVRSACNMLWWRDRNEVLHVLD